MSDPMDISRKLVAVFAADVGGHSRLMGADEVDTLKRLTVRRATSTGSLRTTGAGPHGEHRGVRRRIRWRTSGLVFYFSTAPVQSLKPPTL
jgi:hypothetical protein